ncbi:MAG: phosphoribosylanthranilate isomerase [Calditrichaeota bacterium]|nr:phosphoribosylanthranilate isomerase [Calditrichota bacterium]HQU72305.1 phosphoribosylanthranilate isomerase [Calditrichia bacterium]
MLRVKICGITRRADAEKAISLGADALGFIFYPPSPRYIEPKQAAAIIREVPPDVRCIGVVVSPIRAEAENLVEELSLSALQVHGEHRGILNSAVPPKARWLAFQAGEQFDPDILQGFGKQCEHFLLDAHRPGQFGGTGQPGNWEIAVAAKRYGSVILAGGLNPANLKEAVAAVQPFAIDLNSGVEKTPGIKDHHKLEQAFQIIKEIRGENPTHPGH